VLHGRNDVRSRDALAAATGARGAVSGDLSTIVGATAVADAVNKLGRFDAAIMRGGVHHSSLIRLSISAFSSALRRARMSSSSSGCGTIIRLSPARIA
jgi:hypothetical protein